MCHQTVSLVARELESSGIPTVVMGCAWDIVTQAGAPRFLCSDFPLGHSAGKPFDVVSQDDTLQQALRLFAEPAVVARRNPQRWAQDESWQRDFMNVSNLSAEQLQRLRRSFDDDKALAKRNQGG